MSKTNLQASQLIDFSYDVFDYFDYFGVFCCCGCRLAWQAQFACGSFLRTVHLLAQHRLLDYADNFGLRACHLAARRWACVALAYQYTSYRTVRTDCSIARYGDVPVNSFAIRVANYVIKVHWSVVDQALQLIDLAVVDHVVLLAWVCIEEVACLRPGCALNTFLPRVVVPLDNPRRKQ